MQNLKKIAKDNPVVGRAKAVKDLMLEKLDQLLASLETQNQHIETLKGHQEHTQSQVEQHQIQTQELFNKNQIQTQGLFSQNQELLSLLHKTLESQALSLKSLVDIAQGTHRLLETQNQLRGEYQALADGVKIHQQTTQNIHQEINQTSQILKERLDQQTQKNNHLLNAFNEFKEQTIHQHQNITHTLENLNQQLSHYSQNVVQLLEGVNQAFNNPNPVIDGKLQKLNEQLAHQDQTLQGILDVLNDQEVNGNHQINQNLEVFKDKLNDKIVCHQQEISRKVDNFSDSFFVHTQTFSQGLETLQQAFNHSHQSLSDQLFTLRENTYSLENKINQVSSEIANVNHLQPNVIQSAPDVKNFYDIELDLMAYLYSFLPYPTAIDIGANRGEVSQRLLDTGYEVYAFEPFPPVVEILTTRFAQESRFHLFPVAIGSQNETKDLHIASDQTADGIYEDATFYSSLTPHSLAEGLVFTHTIPVTVKTLASLHDGQELPTDIGLVKIDTEGFDLQVILGMGDHRYPVVVAEFWDKEFPFGQTGAYNHIKDLVTAMKQRHYLWHIIFYRIWGSDKVSFYANSFRSVENSWGNIFFFQDYEVFRQALKWSSALITPTYFPN